MRTTRLLALAAAAALTLGLAATGSAAASGSASPSAAEEKVVFTVGMLGDIDSANPFTGIAAESYEIFQLTYPTLTEYAATDFSIVPGLAESWAESADQTTWTYKIREGVLWSDGTPLTAKDVAYTFNRVLDNEYEQTNYGSYVENITKVEATDDTTVVFTVSRPSPIMEKLYVYILPEHIWSEIDAEEVTSYKNEGTPDSPTVGGGSFVMIERKVGQFIRMQANDNYYGGRPAVDELVFRVYKNEDALGQALKSGEIDFAAGLNANVAESLEGVEGITTVSAVYSGFDQIAFNVGAALDDGTPIGDGNPLLKDIKLRQALQWAVDRQALVDKVLSGGGTSGSTVIPPIYENLHLVPQNPFGYDPEKAKALLDDAGYAEGPDGVRVDSEGNELRFRLFSRSDSPTSQKSSEFVKSYFEAVGVAIDLKVVSEDALIEIVGQGNFDMFEWGWVVEPDPNYQLSTFTCANRSYKDGEDIFANLSDSFYCDEEYDALFEQQSVETDAAKRAEIVKQMQQKLYDDSPYLVTFYYDNYEAYRSDRFTGFVPQPDPDGALLFQYGTWSYDSMKPVVKAEPGEDGASSTGSDSGVNWPVIIGIGALVVVAGVVGALLARGRNKDIDSDDRE
jgi:peptide/nickel transport system substrate-binding protein